MAPEYRATSEIDPIEAAERVIQYLHAYGRADLIGMINAVGIPLSLAEDMKLSEIVDAISVRISDIARRAGIPIKQGDV